MRSILLLVSLISSVAVTSCDYMFDDRYRRLRGDDVRIFKGTKAWELANAIEDEDTALIRKLVVADTSLLRVRDTTYGRTPLMFAVSAFRYGPVLTLLEFDKDINVRDSFIGTTTLIDACENPYVPLKIVEALVRHGANVNDRSIGGKMPRQLYHTPLTAAASNGRADIVQLLLRSAANIEDTTSFGTTAFAEAIRSERYGLALDLIRRGADFTRLVTRAGVDDSPVFVLEALRDHYIIHLGSKEHREKMELVAYLKTKGLHYDAQPIPDYVVERVRARYPNSWQEFLRQY